MPLISVIMPVYNKAIYLKKCINSLINQTFTDFEVLIIDDGSTDNSFDICKEFSEQDKRIKLIQIENNGVSNARNIGLKNAVGDYIQFIDGDDYVDLNMFDKLSYIIKKNSPDMIFCGITKVDNGYNEINKILPKLKGMKSRKEMLDSFAEEQFRTGLYGCVSNKIMKRSIIENIKLEFNKDIKLAEDLDFYLTLYNHIDNIYFCNESYYYYLQNAENSSVRVSKNDYFIQILIILRAKKLLCENNALNSTGESIINKTITNFTLCYLYDEFNYSYLKSKDKFNKIYNSQMILSSLVNIDQQLFRRIIINLIKEKRNFKLWIILYLRKISEVIYRKIKYGILKGRI